MDAASTIYLSICQSLPGQIMALYNMTNAAVLDPPTLLPADCPLRDDVLANFEDEAPIEQLCGGTGRFNG